MPVVSRIDKNQNNGNKPNCTFLNVPAIPSFIYDGHCCNSTVTFLASDSGNNHDKLLSFHRVCHSQTSITSSKDYIVTTRHVPFDILMVEVADPL